MPVPPGIGSLPENPKEPGGLSQIFPPCRSTARRAKLRRLPRPHPSGASTKLGPVGHGVSLQASCELLQGLEPQFPACFLGTLVLENGIRDWSKVRARVFVLARMTSAKDPDCMNVETISP